MTTAYTLSVKDALNLKIVTKDPSSIVDEEWTFTNQAKAARRPKSDANSQACEVYSQAYRTALTSGAPTLRSDTRDKSINTYPEMNPRARAYHMAKDACEAAIIREATIQAKADQVKAEKAETDKVKAEKAAADEAKAANKHQAKAMNNGKSQDAAVTLVTREQKQEGLKIWKELLMQTNDYQPFKQCTEVENLKEVKVLRSAMSHYRSLKLSGMEGLRATHPEFRYLQEKYRIPGEFSMPKDFFREEQLDYNVAYHKRCCSVYEFYNMLSIDNPCFEDRQARRAKNDTLADSNETVKSLRHEHPAAQDNLKRRDPPQTAVPTRTDSEQRPTPNVTSAKRTVNPAFNPFIHTSAQPQRQDVITFRSTNPSNLNREQRESAEKAEVRRRTPKNAPIPSDGDETNTDGETS